MQDAATATTATTATAAIVARLAAQREAQVLETHISWVLLAGAFAYKLKKPVCLPFVDYSTLERRRHCCEEEVRLNRRLAPSLYLGVSRVTGTADEPVFDGEGDTLDYAVRMRRFPPGALFSEQVASGHLGGDAVDRFAELLSRFHAQAPVAASAPVPALGQRLARARAALEGASGALGAQDRRFLEAWIAERCEALAPLWTRRLSAGRVRECHGDLHLGNIVMLGAEIAAFDCIEFEPALRWIDIVEDAAFCLMDFCARGCAGLGWRFINAWLEETGDYDALPALAMAVVERALVRAQVEQMNSPGGDAARSYARTALAWARGRRPLLAITTGLPGSGKSFAAQRFAQHQGAIRLRSDAERKRLFGLGPLEDSRARGLDLYTPEATRQTYARLFTLARTALKAGLPVILDAAFLRRDERAQARALAHSLGVPFSILACEAPLPVLRQRVAARRGDPSEADLAVLEHLRLAAQPLDAGEQAFVVMPAAAGT